jgi:c-di-GMP-binding flagellar brake protein YcgR
MDLSIGGARISLAAGQPELGDRITVAIHQDDGPDIRITGRVVATWVDDQQHRTEASVRFEDLALEEFLAVGELMRSGAPMSGDPR